ncbi:hypothetical protein CMV_029886 [Castanea mollissima]|uniref:Rapid ALkalinization Factor n=1 Tax=Castanea mollissima TaxID=60419 RepID=A0A8J4Q845_9ROSI|nr:hypothetical protein CMV_029886 [Castanea mollissima]
MHIHTTHDSELPSFEREKMGANEKRSLSVSAKSIFLVILLQLVFNTNHTGATTSLSAQFNFNNNNSSSTYHCNGSVDECLIMDGIDSGLIFMDSVHSTRMLDEVNLMSIADNALDPNLAAVRTCGKGSPYGKCLPNSNPSNPCAVYRRDCIH